MAGSWWERPDYESSAERQELAGAEREREERGRNLAASSPFSPRWPRRRLFFSLSPSPPFPRPSSVASSPSSSPPTRRLASAKRPHDMLSRPRRRRGHLLIRMPRVVRASRSVVASSPLTDRCGPAHCSTDRVGMPPPRPPSSGVLHPAFGACLAAATSPRGME